jgi:hypothetical protein
MTEDDGRGTKKEAKIRKAIKLYLSYLCYFSNVLHQFRFVINSPTELVIPAAAKRRAGIQKWPYDYWILAFAGMTDGGKQLVYLIAGLITSEDSVSYFK